MSKISNIILRNHNKPKEPRSISVNLPNHIQTHSVNTSSPISNPYFTQTEMKKHIITLSSYSEVISTTQPIILEQDTAISQTLIPNKRYDYGSKHLENSNIPLSNSASFCYQSEPRGGVVSLSSSPTKNIMISTSTSFKTRKNNRSLTEIKGIHRNSQLLNKKRTIHDDMKDVWLKEMSVSTADSFELGSVSNELVLPKKDWIYLEVIDNEISFHYKTLNAIHEFHSKPILEKAIDFSILEHFKQQSSFEMYSFEKEIIGEAKPIMTKPKTVLKAVPNQLKSKSKNSEEEEDDNDIAMDHFSFDILLATHQERWTNHNEIAYNKEVSLNLLSNDNSVNDSNDKYYLIHQRQDRIINKVLISSLQMPKDSSLNYLLNKHLNWNQTLFHEPAEAFSISSPPTEAMKIQFQAEGSHQVLSPFFERRDSFSFGSIYPIKKWDPVKMRKENQERIDYLIEKSILVRSNGNRHIKEVYKMEYDESIEEIVEEEIQPKLKSKPKVKDNSIQSLVQENSVFGLSSFEKWNERNKVKQIIEFTIQLKLNNAKWQSNMLYPIQSNSISFRTKSDKRSSSYVISNSHLSFNFDQRTLYRLKENSYEIHQEKLSYEPDFIHLYFNKAKTFQIKVNEYFDYLNEAKDTEIKPKIDEYLLKQMEEEELLALMISRWNNNNTYAIREYELNQCPSSPSYYYENCNNALTILPKERPIRRSLLIPYQAINFHLNGLNGSKYYLTKENQMEIIVKNRHEHYFTSLKISENATVEYFSVKKRGRVKDKKLQEKDNNGIEKDKEGEVRENTEIIAANDSKENKQKSEEEALIDNQKTEKSNIEVEAKKKNENKDSQVLKRNKKQTVVDSNKKSPYQQFEKNNSLPSSNKHHNEMFSQSMPSKNHGETTIKKPKEKKKPLPVKPMNYDFEIYTKDLGTQKIKTSNS